MVLQAQAMAMEADGHRAAMVHRVRDRAGPRILMALLAQATAMEADVLRAATAHLVKDRAA